MATRSTIALEYQDGTVRQVYCHWDGYLSNNGRILQESWQDPVEIAELIDLGDLSSLGSKIGVKCDFSNPPNDQCVFYGRDRGEDGVGARYYRDFDSYRENSQDEEFNYIFRRDSGWQVEFDRGRFNGPLEEALRLDDI